MSARLALHLLGPPQIYLDNEPITLERRKALALLAYLAVERGEHSRESLSALLWPDYSQSNAFKNLRQILWELQKTIGASFLLANREKVGLNNTEQIWHDVHEFESLFAEGCVREGAALRIPLLRDLTKLYRNHFLTGFSLKDAYPFNDWAFAESEDLRHKLTILLNKLSEDHCAIGQAAEAIPYARRLVTLDPLNESAHRQLMDVYLQAGQPSAALKQYQACEQILRKELGMDPQPETRDLYKKIRKREIRPTRLEQPKETNAPLHNLPVQLSSFIGREKEQKVIARLITHNRLVTLIGAGGIGKTRLALKVGEQQLRDFSHGVWFVELASLNEPSLVPRAVSALFGIVERSKDTLSQKLVHFLQPKTALLILDNCEHLLTTCVELAELLLKSCPHLKILATSREGFGIPGEALYRVPSLSIPKAKPDFDQLADYESVRLFTDRARLVASDFSPKMENIPTIAQICRRLDGIPLAIELAAARVHTLSVEQIATRLNESFSLLASNSRTKLARQQTLQASIDWSWNLLSDPERLLLRRLSIFAGGWTLEAAESVCTSDGIEHQQVLDLMTQLAMKSLVAVEQEPIGDRRYHLLEMIRQFAREKLAQSGEEENLGKRHLDYFLQLSEKIEAGLVGPEQSDWFIRVNHEVDNLRIALRYASRINHVQAGLYIASRLYRFWQSFNMQEAVDWLTQLLQNPESRNYPATRAHALCKYGWLLAWLQKFRQAQSVAEECLELFRACEDKWGEVDALLLLGNTIEFQGTLAPATQHYEQALTLAQSIGYSWSQARAHYYMGYDRRNIARSFDHLERAVILLREVGDWAALANTLGVLGTFRVWNGEVDVAQKYFDEATQLWRQTTRVDIWENAKVGISLLARLRGDYEQARTLLQETLLVAEETGNRMSYLWTRAQLGQVVLREGNVAEAHKIFIETVREFQKDGNTIGTVFGLEGMSSLLVMVGQPEQAAHLIGWADATREQIPDVRPLIEQADIDRSIAAILARIGSSAFEIAYDEGRSMTLEEAVAYVIKEQT